MQNTHFLTADTLECCRDDRILFSGINFSLNPGEMLQVSGPNGSGKSSLLRILAGILLPTEGRVSWRGKDISQSAAEYRAELAYVGHKTGVKMGLTVAENLRMTNLLRAKTKLNKSQSLSAFALNSFTHTFCDKLSAGQRQRLALAGLTVFFLRLWILDEPFTALDKAGINAIESAIAQHLAQGGMVVVTSHQALSNKDIPVQYLELG